MLDNFHWERVIVDEAHEVFTDPVVERTYEIMINTDSYSYTYDCRMCQWHAQVVRLVRQCHAISEAVSSIRNFQFR